MNRVNRPNRSIVLWLSENLEAKQEVNNLLASEMNGHLQLFEVNTEQWACIHTIVCAHRMHSVLPIAHNKHWPKIRWNEPKYVSCANWYMTNEIHSTNWREIERRIIIEWFYIWNSGTHTWKLISSNLIGNAKIHWKKRKNQSHSVQLCSFIPN